MTPREAFEELGLGTNASADDVKKAYRRAASKHHPDKGGNKEEFQRAHDAFTVAMDNIGRPTEDFFSGFNGNFDELKKRSASYTFNERPNQNTTQRQPKPRVHMVVEHPSIYLSLREAYAGCVKSITIKTQSECQICVGLGYIVNGFVPCQQCESKGYAYDYFTMNVRIQPKCKDVTYVKECRHPDISNVVRLTVKTMTAEREFTRIDGDSLQCDLPVPFNIALFGGEVRRKTFDGTEISIKIPEGTNAGSVLRVGGGHGFTDSGALYCDIIITVPTSLTDKQRDALLTYHRGI